MPRSKTWQPEILLCKLLSWSLNIFDHPVFPNKIVQVSLGQEITIFSLISSWTMKGHKARLWGREGWLVRPISAHSPTPTKMEQRDGKGLSPEGDKGLENTEGVPLLSCN